MRRLLCAVLLLATACSLPLPDGVRTPSGVTGRRPADLQALPQGPTAGQSQIDTVIGFLAAQASPLGGYAIAREFLTGAAAQQWDPGLGVRVYSPDSEQVQQVGPVRDKQVQVSLTSVATVDPAGHYVSGTRRTTDAYGVTKVGSGWRISALPSGVGLQLSPLDLLRTYAERNAYYLAPRLRPGDPRHLVPDRVFLPTGPDLTDALVRRALEQPSLALVGSVDASVSPALAVRAVDRDREGVVTVTLSDDAAGLSPDDLRDLYARLVWTLRQDERFRGLRLRTQAQVLHLDGDPQVEPARAFRDYDPEGLGDPPAYAYLASGHLRSTAPLARSALTDGPALDAVAVAPRGDRVAGLHRRGAAVDVLLGTTRSGLVTTVRGRGLASPTWGSGEGGLWLLQEGRRVVRLDPVTGGLHPVAVAGRPAGTLTSLAVSRDGVRAALVVDGQVLVGRIAWRAGEAAVQDLVALSTSGRAQQVVWASPVDLVVLGRGGTARVVQRVQVDDSPPRVTLPIGLLSPVRIAAAGSTILVESGGTLYGLGQSVPLRKGAFPVYPG